ncbi:MAG: ribosomal RNA small subunit methyltransferase A [Deltaproteobacteria bacterium]|nr:ribosomal RNA small subunit methyltransferase A [Deltaproteobacteria bacterium]MCK5711009.1 ribosomal RNA small subunit methyltransferase A [Deltaproteobacteria bacterium]
MSNRIKPPTNPKEFFLSENSYPSKNLGQNFIKDSRVIDRIVELAELSSEDEVLEIGPGLGALTVGLIEKAGKVVAIEKDKKLVAHLRESFSDYSNVEFVHQDALKADFSSYYSGKKLKAISNLPYSVSSPVLFKLLEARQYFSSMVLMLQLEVGERITAGPGGKTYGSISVLLQTFMDITSVFRVHPASFWPKPKVDSIVLKFVPLKSPRANVSDEKLYERVVRAAFSSRRKMIGNSLQSILSRESAREALELAGIDKTRRAETLTIEEFGVLVDKVSIIEKQSVS